MRLIRQILTVWALLPLTAMARKLPMSSTNLQKILPQPLKRFSTNNNAAQQEGKGGATLMMNDNPLRLQQRGGDNENKQDKKSSKLKSLSTKSLSSIKIPEDKFLIGSAIAIVVGALLYKYRETLRPLTDKQYIQEKTLTILKQLEESPGSIPIYIAGMALWEFFGLSTIPVETAAGMVFGPYRALLASGIGKLTGAYTAFALGRGLLAQQVRNRLAKNQVWGVLNKSTQRYSPLAVGLLMKFSCFPEFVKNFGSSCLEDLSFATFAIATAFHGLMFTTLWTLLGVDAAARLENADLPSNVALQVLLVVAALIGLVGSPLLMAWWIRDMKRNIGGSGGPGTKSD